MFTTSITLNEAHLTKGSLRSFQSLNESTSGGSLLQKHCKDAEAQTGKKASTEYKLLFNVYHITRLPGIRSVVQQSLNGLTSLENIGCVSRVNCLKVTSYSVRLQSNWIMAPLGFNSWFPSVERLWRHRIIVMNFLKIRSRSSILPSCPASGSQSSPRTTSCWSARWTSLGGEQSIALALQPLEDLRNLKRHYVIKHARRC